MPDPFGTEIYLVVTGFSGCQGSVCL
jgi:hypothetical protein